jgi:SET domain-containing protein
MGDLYVIKKSMLHGNGAFATEPLQRGTEVGVVARGSRLTGDFGVYINHSDNPNGYLEDVGDSLYFLTLKRVDEGEELTLNYTDTPYWMEGPDFE